MKMRVDLIHTLRAPAGYLAGGILLAAVAYGGYLRFDRLGAQSLWIDEGYSINAAAGVLAHGYPRMESGAVYRDWLVPTYLTAFSLRTLGFDPFDPASARVPAALAGTALIALAFGFARRLSGTGPAVASALIVAFSAWEIAWSGQARGYTFLSCCIVAALWAAWEAGEKRTLAACAALAGALAAGYFTNALFLLVVPGVAWFWVADQLGRKRLLERLGALRFALVLAALFAVSVAFFELAVRFTRLGVEVPANEYVGFLSGALLPFTLGSLAAFGFALADAGRGRAALYAFLALATPVLFVTEYSPVVQLRYLFPFLPIAAVLLSYAASRAAALIAASDAKRAGIGVALALLAALPSLQFAPGPRVLEYGSPQPDFAGAYATIRERGADAAEVISPYATLTRIYLGSPGTLLLMSLTGKPSDTAASLALGADSYTGAPLIRDEDGLAEALARGHGFVVLDGMALNRLPADAALLASAPGVREVFADGAGIDQVRVYEFGI